MLERSWPLPALLTWLMAWAVCLALRRGEAPEWLALGLPAMIGLGAAQSRAVAGTRWRAMFVAAGFPLSAVVLALGPASSAGPDGQGGWAGGWVWLVPLGLLLLVYPMRAWRDAPVFPTPSDALIDLPRHVPLPAGAVVLDAGCGVGDGLRELRRAYPLAELQGTEWSWPLAWLCRVRCPWAAVRRGDMWADDWSRADLVYLFQRPESMPLVADKALRELKRGAWLVSLEFAVPGWTEVARVVLTEQPQSRQAGYTGPLCLLSRPRNFVLRSASSPRGSPSSRR